MQATAQQATASSGDLDAKQTLTVLGVDLPEILMPVLTVLRRRQCRITMVSFDAGGAHASGHLRIEVAPPARHAHCVAAWVANIVGVDDVEVRRDAAR